MHPLDKFKYCPICGSSHFEEQDEKSKRCNECGFEYYMNPSSANVALILNDKEELLVVRREKEPAKGTLDLPGGFADSGETSEQGVIREVKEETGLNVKKVRYLFSIPNKYRYSDFDIPTLDMFYLCQVDDFTSLKAMDDASEVKWIAIKDIHPKQFGLKSIQQGLIQFIKKMP